MIKSNSTYFSSNWFHSMFFTFWKVHLWMWTFPSCDLTFCFSVVPIPVWSIFYHTGLQCGTWTHCKLLCLKCYIQAPQKKCVNSRFSLLAPVWFQFILRFKFCSSSSSSGGSSVSRAKASRPGPAWSGSGSRRKCRCLVLNGVDGVADGRSRTPRHR